MLTLNTNVASLNAQNNLQSSQTALNTSLQRLSSGMRINSAADDPAGLAIATRFTTQINGLNQAVSNANNAISLAQTAGGALNEFTNNLQTIRSLAVEAANSTNSSSDRADLNVEAQQLLQELQRTATSTQFNGQNILDGSFNNAQFQVGANANQTISVSVGNAQTNALGAYQYNNTSNAVSGQALVSGDLTINGVNVGATANGSADTIVNAINAVTTQTGVTASATSSVAPGSSPTGFQNLSDGDLVINGVDIGVINGAYNVATQGANYATAINAKTASTGVTASANAVTGQITLSSTVGKTIAITSNNGNAGATRVTNATGLTLATGQTVATSTNTFTGTEGTSTAAFAAVATAGQNVIVDGQTYSFVASGAVGNTQVNIGADQTASAANLATAITANEATLGTSAHITAAAATGTLTVTSSYATSSVGNITITGSSAATIVNNVGGAAAGVANQSTITVGGTTYEFDLADQAATGSNTKVVIGTNATTNAQAFLAAVNAAHTAKTADVTASGGAAVITLTSDNKGAQGVTDVTGTSVTGLTVGGAAGGTAGTYAAETGYGAIALNSNSTYQVGGNNSAKAGLSTAGATLTAISTIDISSVTGANSAISLIDGALAQITTIQANLGAVQNRFQSTINSLSTTSTNLSAARSQIEDTNFATETANMTKNQILQQAGTAVLAQANATPQNILTLLK